MSDQKPDHHDADLVLRVYELRREEVMRASRAAINREFWPREYEEVLALLKPEHPLNAAYRQVGSYWEMVYSFARHGIVHREFWLENNAEGLFLHAKVAPYLDRLRQDWQPTAFKNAEWAAKETAAGRRGFEMFLGRVKKRLEAPR
jgi:hypothetical protein